DVERLNQRIGIEEQLQDRIQQPADHPQRTAVRVEEGAVLEGVVRNLRRLVRRLRLPELLEQIGADATGIEERLGLDRRQLANLFLRVVDAALVANARADLLHDLFDVDRIGANGEIGHKQLSALRLIYIGR